MSALLSFSHSDTNANNKRLRNRRNQLHNVGERKDLPPSEREEEAKPSRRRGQRGSREELRKMYSEWSRTSLAIQTAERTSRYTRVDVLDAYEDTELYMARDEDRRILRGLIERPVVGMRLFEASDPASLSSSPRALSACEKKPSHSPSWRARKHAIHLRQKRLKYPPVGTCLPSRLSHVGKPALSRERMQMNTRCLYSSAPCTVHLHADMYPTYIQKTKRIHLHTRI